MQQLSITDLARQYLEKRIFSGELPPGKQIKEDQVAEALEISRPPIREAFKLLEAEGLVIRKPRRGVFVAETTHQDVWEIYTFKAELYTFSIQLGFERFKPADIDAMEKLAAEMKTCVEAEQPDVFLYQELNTRFHDVHVDAAGHQRLKQILKMLHNQIRHFSFHSLSNKAHLSMNYRFHCRILEAFQKGDLESAIEHSRAHVLDGLKNLEGESGGSADIKTA
ncbi:MAG: GntR family transcriptional regulator [Thermodesulfobacteriota bacterium]